MVLSPAEAIGTAGEIEFIIIKKKMPLPSRGHCPVYNEKFTSHCLHQAVSNDVMSVFVL
jgi:hypothetical protein